jgi:hypothetical protein
MVVIPLDLAWTRRSVCLFCRVIGRKVEKDSPVDYDFDELWGSN